jgi:ribA/ribD-fused uncharacterized protein
MTVAGLLLMHGSSGGCAARKPHVVTIHPAATQPARGKVTEFQGPYRFLSNVYPAEVEFEGMRYPSVEHAYQAAKTLDLGERKRIAALPTAAEAKSEGRKLELRPNWETLKFEVMEQCVRYKFTHNPQLKQMLLDTGDAVLEEGNTWEDRVWGIYRGEGENRLGKILMKVRGEIRSERLKN